MSGNYWSSETTPKPNLIWWHFFYSSQCHRAGTGCWGLFCPFPLAQIIIVSLLRSDKPTHYCATRHILFSTLIPASQSFLWNIKKFPYGNVGDLGRPWDFSSPIHWSNCDVILFQLPIGYPGINTNFQDQDALDGKSSLHILWRPESDTFLLHSSAQLSPPFFFFSLFFSSSCSLLVQTLTCIVWGI